jgi:hypothetical protein
LQRDKSLPAHMNGSGIRRRRSRDAFDECRLARAVRTDEPSWMVNPTSCSAKPRPKRLEIPLTATKFADLPRLSFVPMPSRLWWIPIVQPASHIVRFRERAPE